MYEVEIKAYIEDSLSIEKTLLHLGAKFHTKLNQTDTYFQHPLRNFAQTDEALRIRVSDDKSYLTYKGPKIDSTSKTREELELEIQESEKVLQIFKKIGFSIVLNVIKTRKIYSLEGIKIYLDEVEGLGFFIELELDVSEKEMIPLAKERLFSFLKQLKIPATKLERRSYLELLFLNKIKKQKRKI